MLEWFPTPYPEEWLYSVLCRFYVRSGIGESIAVKRILFDGRDSARMGTVFPNQTVLEVVSQLPTNLFDIHEIILNHTPYKFYTRMYPKAERESILEQLCNGETVQLTHLWKSFKRASWAPRFCPRCITEDREKYGEPYWHTDHQIPLMSVCPKHHCALVQMELSPPYPTLNQKFYPLNCVDCNVEPNYHYTTWEETVSRIVREYWLLPLSSGQTEGYNNLVQSLKNKGYLSIMRQGSTSLNKEKLHKDLITFFGEEKVKNVFGEQLNKSMISRITKWEQLLPDRYILLQTMIDLPTETVFSDTQVPDMLKERLLLMEKNTSFLPKRQAAKSLGLKEYELNALMKEYCDIRPFWVEPEKKKYKQPRSEFIRVSLSEEEFMAIEERRESLGYHCAAHFALQCIRYVMQLTNDDNLACDNIAIT